MNIHPALKWGGTVLGSALATGAVSYFATDAAQDHTSGKVGSFVDGALLVGSIGAYGAFMLWPGLPSKPVASGVLAGASLGAQLAMARNRDD